MIRKGAKEPWDEGRRKLS